MSSRVAATGLLAFLVIGAVVVGVDPVFAESGRRPRSVTLCHKPGTPAQTTISTRANAARRHLRHGDHLGACTAPTGGPRATLFQDTFVRDRGRPVTHTRIISIANFRPPFVLHLKSSREGIGGVLSGARIQLNNRPVLRAADIAKLVFQSQVSMPIVLTEPSTLSVEMLGAPGTELMISIEGTPAEDPLDLALEPGRTAALTIYPVDGETITTTGGDGAAFTLDIPRHATGGPEVETITMTPVTTVAGLPAPLRFIAGTEFGPSGLEFLKPLSLTMKLPAGIPLERLTAIGYTGNGNEYAFIPVDSIDIAAGTVTLTVMHFSSAILTEGVIANCVQQGNAQTEEDRYIQAIACALDGTTKEQLRGTDTQDPFVAKRTLISAILTAWHSDLVLPTIRESTDLELTEAARVYANWWNYVAATANDEQQAFKDKRTLAATAIAAKVAGLFAALEADCRSSSEFCRAYDLFEQFRQWRLFVEILNTEFDLTLTIPDLATFCNGLGKTGPVATVELDYMNVSLEVGASFGVTATVKNAAGLVMDPAGLVWTNNAPGIAHIEQRGTRVAGDGTVRAFAVIRGDAPGSALFTASKCKSGSVLFLVSGSQMPPGVYPLSRSSSIDVFHTSRVDSAGKFIEKQRVAGTGPLDFGLFDQTVALDISNVGDLGSVVTSSRATQKSQLLLDDAGHLLGGGATSEFGVAGAFDRQPTSGMAWARSGLAIDFEIAGDTRVLTLSSTAFLHVGPSGLRSGLTYLDIHVVKLNASVPTIFTALETFIDERGGTASRDKSVVLEPGKYRIAVYSAATLSHQPGLTAAEGQGGWALNFTLQPRAVTSVQLFGDGLSLQVGDRAGPLSYWVRDQAGEFLFDKTVTYRSSDPLVASVDADRRITARAPGVAQIVAECDGVTSNAISITVESRPTLRIDPASWRLLPGGTVQLTAILTANGVDFADAGTRWWTSDPAVVTVESIGSTVTATAVNPGTATITAGIPGRSSAAVITVVAPPSIASVTLRPTSATIHVAETVDFSALVTMSDGTQFAGGDMTWSIADANVAAIDHNSAVATVSGVAKGTTVITGTYRGVSGTAIITVTGAATSVRLDVASPALYVGDTVQVRAILTDVNGVEYGDAGTIWSISNSAVATLHGEGDTATLAAIGSGTTVITAQFEGLEATAAITVVGVDSMIIHPADVTIDIGQTIRFKTAVMYADDHQGVASTGVWSSSNPAVARIERNSKGDAIGAATGLSAGSATITVEFGGARANATVTVNAPATTHIVSGQVYYSTLPLHGIRVELRQGVSTGPAFETSHSAVDGHYEFSPVPPGLYWVTVYGDEGFISWLTQSVVVGDDVVLNMYLPKVIAPISPAAAGTVDSPNPTLKWTSNAEAEAGGSYTITINQSTTWALAEIGDSATNRYDVQNALTVGVEYSWLVEAFDTDGHPVGTGWATFVVRPPSGTFRLSGNVYYSATPLQGATVSLHVGSPLEPALQTVQSGSDGSFALTSLAAGVYWLRVNGEGDFLEWTAQTVEVSTSDVSWNLYLPKKITLLSPSDGSTVNTAHPVLTWTPNPEADAGGHYTIQINESVTWAELEMSETPSASYTVQTPMTPGVEYTWQVDAYDAGMNRVGTTRVAFRVTPSP